MLTPTRHVSFAAAAFALTFTTACSPQFGQESHAEDARTPDVSSARNGMGSPDNNDLRLQIAVEDVELTSTLHDSPASHDLIEQLPLSMTDHGSVEKTGPLPGPFTLNGQPAGADPVPGDLGHYAPGNDLVLYYGDPDYYDGIIILGSLHGDIDAIAEYDEVTVRVARATR